LRQCIDDVSGLLGMVQEQQRSESAQPQVEQPQAAPPATQLVAPPATQPEIGASITEVINQINNCHKIMLHCNYHGIKFNEYFSLFLLEFILIFSH